MVYIVILGQVFCPCSSAFTCRYYSTSSPYSCIHLSLALYNLRNLQRRYITRINNTLRILKFSLWTPWSHRGVEVKLHSLFASTLDGCGWLAPRPREGAQCFPLNRRTGGFQCQFGRIGGNKVSFPFRYLNTISELYSLAAVLVVTEKGLGHCDNGCASSVVSNAVVKVWLV